MSLLSGTNDIKAASPALLQRHRQRPIPATQVKFLNSFVHMSPYHDPDADITCSSPAFNSRFSGGSTVDMICLSLKQQKHSSVIPGLITRVGEYAIPGKGGRCDQRDQELEAGFIKQFECCQLQINGMHELLDHGPHSKANDPALTQRLPVLRSDPVGGEVDRSVHGQPCPDWNATSKGDDASAASDPFQIPQAEMLAHKHCRQKLKQVARDNSAAECTDIGPGVEGARRYTCPVEGCDKTYKQANGLKYHLT
ncbi:hypothetical protein QFC20_003869 [Naganishia adeliensis]|uniref:Uncharacterized protein n=1 Tax=Naganishia adeliensis TaxID=92952 RepID=A0ACC2W723_9TREE|nr:hypothetical protein QFC20_003869 [Naganishia adeliensis]